MSVFELMLAPFVECLILVGIHSYLGLHVIRRRVIFVDLALAQIAALGTTVGVVFGLMPDTAAAFVYSLTFCLLGALLFAFTRVRHDRIPHEAVIGLVYAITAALAILVVQKTKGSEHLDSILVGSLLWVKWSDIIAAGIAYALIGGFHLLFWKRFLLISEYPEKAYRQGLNVRIWDFLFYASFGFVITFSTRVAGVLLVFVFLVAPAIMSVMVTRRFGRQLIVGWLSGTVVTVLGLYLSYDLDLPSGPTVVAFYGVVLALTAVVNYLVRAENKARAWRYVGLGFGVVAAVSWAVGWEGSLLAEIDRLPLNSVSEQYQGNSRVPSIGPARPTPTASPVVSDAPDPGQALDDIRLGLRTDRKQGLIRLVALLEQPDLPPFFCGEATQLLSEAAGQKLPFDCEAELPARRQAIQAIHDWLKSQN